jgi:hypothetical protein
MRDKEIIKRAISKAISGGWKGFTSTIKGVDYRKGKIERNVLMTFHATDGDITIMYNLEAIIFNHDFAKALWGEEEYITPVYHLNKAIWIYIEGLIQPKLKARYNTISEDIGIPPINGLASWQYHLQQMVIADDPIEYLGKHIK